MHIRYRLSAIEIYEAVAVLQRLGIVERRNIDVRICENLDELKLSIMNRLSKTSRPPQLDQYAARSLTNRKKQVS